MTDLTPEELAAQEAELAAALAAQEVRIKAQRIREYGMDRMILPPAMFAEKWPVPPEGAA